MSRPWGVRKRCADLANWLRKRRDTTTFVTVGPAIVEMICLGGPAVKMPGHAANPCLAVLIQGGGFASLEKFAAAVNERGWYMHGIKTCYDHISVKRWLAGGVCQNPDVVAAVLGDAWGVPVPVQVIWPELRNGGSAIPPHLQPWVAARTLEDLGVFLRSDMLTRREALTSAITVASGPAFLTPLECWLGAAPGRLTNKDEGAEHVGVADVAVIERSTRYFAATDADVGGGLGREAAVGQLKYAVDLARHARYSEAVGNRLLAAIAELSGMVGWLCHDSNMPGPAQRYFVYGLQAARESTDPRARTLVVSILTDMATHMRWRGQPHTALHLLDLAARQLPADRSRFNIVRAILASKRVETGLCYLGSSCLPEIRKTLSLSLGLHRQASDEERAITPGMWHRAFDMEEAELAGMASAAYLVRARQDPSMAKEAQARTQHHLATVGVGQRRNTVFSQIRLACVRFVAGEPEQACEDGHQALDVAKDTASSMVKARLCELMKDSEPYARLAPVRELRGRTQASLAA